MVYGEPRLTLRRKSVAVVEIPVQQPVSGVVGQFGDGGRRAPQESTVGRVGQLSDRLRGLLQHRCGDVTEAAQSLRRGDRDQPRVRSDEDARRHVVIVDGGQGAGSVQPFQKLAAARGVVIEQPDRSAPSRRSCRRSSMSVAGESSSASQALSSSPKLVAYLNDLTNPCGRGPNVQQSTGQTNHSRIRPDAGEATIALRMRCSSTRSWGVTLANLRSYSAARAASARSRACVPSAVSTSR